MKKISLLLLFAMASCNAQDKQFTDQALDQKLQTPDGHETTLRAIIDKHKGHTVMIENWASWCGDCVKAMPKLKATMAANPAVDYVFISMDKSAEKWKEGIDKHQLKGDHYWAAEGMKGPFGQAIDLDWIPRYIILDKTGKVVVYRAIETDFDKIGKTLKSLEP
jgi:thiol-disulfide isomerase/thioredoxin